MKKPEKRLLKALPSKPIVPPSKLEEYKILIFGTKGIGKTTLANSFEDAFTLVCEAPRRNLRINGYPNYAAGDPPLTYEYANDVIDLFLESNYKTLVVDTADRLYELCQLYVRKINNVEHEGDMDWGKGWDLPREYFEDLLNRVAFSDKGLLLISHVVQKERVSWVTEEGGNEIRPSMDKRAWQWAQTAADIVLCYDFIGSDRVCIVRGNERVMARCGLEDRFIADDGEPLNAFKVPNDPSASYETLLAAFNNELPDYFRSKETEAKAKKKEVLAKLKNKVKVVKKK